jgi:hypothetical protein
MWQVIPPYSTDQRRQALKHALMLLHSEGMTGFKVGPTRTQSRSGQSICNQRAAASAVSSGRVLNAIDA